MIKENEVLIYKIIYISLGVLAQLISLSYLRHHSNWKKIGRFSECYILLLIFLSEYVKEKLTRFYYDYVRINCDGIDKEQREHHSFKHRICYAILIQLSTLFVYAFICFTLGAPMFHSYEKTFILSMLLTLLTITPAVLIFGGLDIVETYFTYYDERNGQSVQGSMWMIIKHNSIGALVGAWAASIVMPLDWDREWQEYPIPNVIGAIAGSLAANLYSLGCVACDRARSYLRCH